MRRSKINRETTETEISVQLSLDGNGRYDISTGIRFLDHMLELVTRHGAFNLKLKARGDLDVDQHHTVEDVGIVLGEAVSKALGSRRGIHRAGYFIMRSKGVGFSTSHLLVGVPMFVVGAAAAAFFYLTDGKAPAAF